YLPFFLYTPILEYLTGGQTIGKYALGIQVISSKGDRITFQKAFLRWLFRPVEFYLLAFGSAAILLIFFVGLFDLSVTVISKYNQRIGDFMSDTNVIKKRSAMKYSLSDVLKIDTRSSHEVRYPEAVSFTDDDMLLVKKTILAFEQNPTNIELFEIMKELEGQAKITMNIVATDQKDLNFLRQLLKDYVVLTR
ncbi:MAG: RDD family protein, partial [Crocinitomicaceae bacterium]|nr:RDD family protein [Crocinitomicaceae bacterium]